MITADDLEYHTPEDAAHTWAETFFFAIALPEEHILATVYAAVRPGIGVMMTDVGVWGALSDNRADMLYMDQQSHQPAPARFSDIHGPAGLSIKSYNAPMDYRIDYVGHSGAEIHVDWRSLMEPFDIHDPNHSPNAGRHKKDWKKTSGLGEAWGGHFDLSGRVTGTLKVRGVEYAVDSLERMDHSWGHRDLIKLEFSQYSISAAFDEEELAFHIITQVDISRPTSSQQVFAHGYVLENGEVHGVASARVVANRLRGVTTGMEMDVVDVRGKTYRLYAMADVGGPWNAYAGTTTYTLQMTWICEGRKGYGCVMETIGQPLLSRRYARRYEDPQPVWITG